MIVRERTAARPSPERVARPAGRPGWTAPGAVLALLPVVALAELLLVRTFYRVGIYIPREGPFRDVYRVLTAVGSFALNLSSVLALLGLGILAAGAVRKERRGAGFAVGAFVLAAVLARLSGAQDVTPVARLLFVLAVAAVAWPFLTARATWPDRLAVAGVALSILLSSFAGFAADAERIAPASESPVGPTVAQLAGEAVVLLTAFLLFAASLTRSGPRARPIVAGALPAAALVAAWRANGAITGILVLWTAGLRLYLPLWLYALALWAFSAAAVGVLRERPWRAAGLVLLLVGGFLLESTYVQALALLGLLLLTDGIAVGGLPGWPRRAPAQGRPDARPTLPPSPQAGGRLPPPSVGRRGGGGRPPPPRRRAP